MNPSKVVKVASGVALLGIAMGSFALTLGRAQDVAWIGKPLDVRFQVQPDGDGDLQPDCLAAEVLYGDTPLDPARIAVTAKTATGAGHNLRVATTLPINEPVVTVLLRVGCQQKLSKRYTFFAEPPTQVVEPFVATTPRSRMGEAAQPPMSTVRSDPANDVPAATARRGRFVRADAAPMQTPASVPVTVVRPTKPASKAVRGPRLKLDALDLLIERDPVLRASNELLTLPQEDGAKRAEAAALWRSLNVSPEQVLQDEARAIALEKDMKSLHSATAQNQKGLQALQGKVQQAESERYANGLVYGLVALWAAILAAMVWFWRRAREQQASDWLSGHDARDSEVAETVQRPVVEAVLPSSPVPRVEPVVPVANAPFPQPRQNAAAFAGDAPALIAAATAAAPLSGVDIELEINLDDGPLEPVVHTPTPAPKLPAHPMRDFYPSGAAALRACDSAELVDVREQADFFVSLGQYDRAIDILTTRVAQFGESSPLVCLDLLRMYHDLGRQAEFETMRTEFNHWFSGYVPEFSEFGNDGRSLEAYPHVMERITLLWPSPQVLEYIEGCLYRQATGDEGLVFELNAYLDLLLLHGVAKQMVRHANPLQPGSKSEAVRIPARSHAAMAGDASQSEGSEPVPHRSGAKRRGSQFGALKYPPTNPHQESTVDLTQPSDEDPDSQLTDFNFVGIR
jgi:hypothetical protein|nr:hypothetical protein [Rhodoferax sp.]